MTANAVLGALLLLGWACWAVRRLAVFCRRCPPLARLAGSRAAQAAAERRLVHRLATRQIDEAGYRSAMRSLADRLPGSAARKRT